MNFQMLKRGLGIGYEVWVWGYQHFSKKNEKRRRIMHFKMLVVFDENFFKPILPRGNFSLQKPSEASVTTEVAIINACLT